MPIIGSSTEEYLCRDRLCRRLAHNFHFVCVTLRGVAFASCKAMTHVASLLHAAVLFKTVCFVLLVPGKAWLAVPQHHGCIRCIPGLRELLHAAACTTCHGQWPNLCSTVDVAQRSCIFPVSHLSSRYQGCIACVNVCHAYEDCPAKCGCALRAAGGVQGVNNLPIMVCV